MALDPVNEGEDVPIIAEFDDGTTDPDDTDATADGVPDASITITYEDESVVVTDAAMAHLSTGRFEYVWDTAADATGAGIYFVKVSAEFGGETKIERSQIRVR